jgi:2-phospho-L-lactate guanylyltransferase (CobY/MobA/RfbA family)
MYIISEEDRKWFMEAMQAQSVDVIKRMKEITLVMQTPEQVLEAQGVTSADIEGSIISQMGSSTGPFFKFCFIFN